MESKIQMLLNLGIEIKPSGAKEQKVKCPRCSESRKKKSERCLSVNIEEGIYNCFHCGWGGRVSERKEVDKVYIIPDLKNATEVSDNMLGWFRSCLLYTSPSPRD